MDKLVYLSRRFFSPSTVLSLLTIIAFSEGLNRNGLVRHEERLYNDLFDGYNKVIRPVLNPSEAVHVTFGFALSEIIDVDEKNQVLTTNVWVRQTWKDVSFAWNSSRYGNVTSINVDAKKVWVPDIVLYNKEFDPERFVILWEPVDSLNRGSCGGSRGPHNYHVIESTLVCFYSVNNNDHGEQYLFNTKVVIRHDGTFAWYSPNKFNTFCKIDVRLFPFDTQECRITFGSWTYTGDEIDLYFYKNASRADLGIFSKNGEWDLTSAEGVRNVISYDCCSTPFIDLTYDIIIRRRPLFFLNNLILPCIVLALLTSVSFLFPPETGERISLVITVLLGMTVFMIIFTEAIPATSEATPLIGKYFAAVLFEVALCLLATCVPLRLQHLHPGTEMPRWAKVLIFDYIGYVMCFRSSRPLKKGRKKESLSGKVTKIHSYTNDDIKLSDTDIIENGYIKDNEKTMQRSAAFENNPQGKPNDYSVVNEYIKTKEREDELYAEWKNAISVLDRLFFWLFNLTFVVSSVVILYGYSRN